MVLKIMNIRLVAIILPALIISGCSSAVQASLPTETYQPTIEATLTQLSSTSTPEPENTPTYMPTSVTSSSMGTPVSDWKGIPVIPGANEGEPAGFGYIY
jgi:PBP1b-binding outer membrane lipoprotein LpoB